MLYFVMNASFDNHKQMGLARPSVLPQANASSAGMSSQGNCVVMGVVENAIQNTSFVKVKGRR